jgi:hypothetical protein
VSGDSTSIYPIKHKIEDWTQASRSRKLRNPAHASIDRFPEPKLRICPFDVSRQKMISGRTRFEDGRKGDVVEMQISALVQYLGPFGQRVRTGMVEIRDTRSRPCRFFTKHVSRSWQHPEMNRTTHLAKGPKRSVGSALRKITWRRGALLVERRHPTAVAISPDLTGRPQ